MPTCKVVEEGNSVRDQPGRHQCPQSKMTFFWLPSRLHQPTTLCPLGECVVQASGFIESHQQGLQGLRAQESSVCAGLCM